MTVSPHLPFWNSLDESYLLGGFEVSPLHCRTACSSFNSQASFLSISLSMGSLSAQSSSEDRVVCGRTIKGWQLRLYVLSGVWTAYKQGADSVTTIASDPPSITQTRSLGLSGVRSRALWWVSKLHFCFPLLMTSLLTTSEESGTFGSHRWGNIGTINHSHWPINSSTGLKPFGRGVTRYDRRGR